jgi:hypothetical protein
VGEGLDLARVARKTPQCHQGDSRVLSFRKLEYREPEAAADGNQPQIPVRRYASSLYHSPVVGAIVPSTSMSIRARSRRENFHAFTVAQLPLKRLAQVHRRSCRSRCGSRPHPYTVRTASHVPDATPAGDLLRRFGDERSAVSVPNRRGRAGRFWPGAPAGPAGIHPRCRYSERPRGTVSTAFLLRACERGLFDEEALAVIALAGLTPYQHDGREDRMPSVPVVPGCDDGWAARSAGAVSVGVK